MTKLKLPKANDIHFADDMHPLGGYDPCRATVHGGHIIYHEWNTKRQTYLVINIDDDDVYFGLKEKYGAKEFSNLDDVVKYIDDVRAEYADAPRSLTLNQPYKGDKS